jgi:hypothetical protein
LSVSNIKKDFIFPQKSALKPLYGAIYYLDSQNQEKPSVLHLALLLLIKMKVKMQFLLKKN